MNIKLDKQNNRTYTSTNKLDKREKVDIKVDRLEDFCRSNPVIWICGEDFLNTIKDKEERETLENRLNQAYKDYRYITVRKSKGKLSNEHTERLREAGVGRVFGYKKEIEDIANRYSYEDADEFKKFLYCASAKYGSLDNFRLHYIQSLIDGTNCMDNIESVFYNSCPKEVYKYFITDFDISSPNFQNEKNDGYMWILCKLENTTQKSKGVIINKAKLKKAIEELKDNYLSVLKLRSGLEDGKRHSLSEIAEMKGCTRMAVLYNERQAIGALRRNFMKPDFQIKEEDKRKNFIKKFFEYHDIFADEKQTKLDPKALRILQSILDAGNNIQTNKKDSEFSDSTKDESAKIEDLNLSTNSSICLRRAKIKTVKDITKLTAQDFRKMQKLNKQDFEDIVNAVHSSGLEMKWEKDSKLSDSKKVEIETEFLNVSYRTFNCLKRNGINNVHDIIDLEEKSFWTMRNMGEKSGAEVIDAIHSLGLKMNWEKDDLPKDVVDENLGNAIQQLKDAYVILDNKTAEYEGLEKQLKYKLNGNMDTVDKKDRASNEENEPSLED